MEKAKSTQDWVLIEEWVKNRKGIPCKVKGTEDLLRIRFDPMEKDLEEITWAEFFQIFDKNKLKFLYEDSKDSRFYKFIN